MSKIKLSPGLAAVVLLACLFSGWSTLLTVTVLMFLFCEVDEKVKAVAVKVIAFYAGIALFSMAWGLIVDGIALVISSFKEVINVFNGYLTEPIDVTKLYQNLLNPISSVVGILDGIVAYLITFAKFGFIVAVLTSKTQKENIVTKKINEYVTKVLNYINSIDVPNAQVAPQVAAEPTDTTPVA